MLLIVAGSAIAAISFNALLRPVGVPPGGMVGASLVIQKITGFEPGYVQWVLNILILAASGWVVGRAFLLKSLAGTLLLPLFVVLTRDIPAPTANPVLAALCGGAGVGLGIGMVFRAGSSVGGFSAVAVALNRAAGLQIHHVLFALDGVVALAAASVFSVELAIAGVMSSFVVSQAARAVITGFDRSRVAVIVTRHAPELREIILHQLPLGLTILEGRGGYSGEARDILMVVMNPTESVRLLAQVRSVDAQAFVVLLDASEVRGRGFTAHT